MNVPRPVGTLISPLANQVARGTTLVRGIGGFFNKVLQKTPYEGLVMFLDQTYGSFVSDELPATRQHSLAAARSSNCSSRRTCAA